MKSILSLLLLFTTYIVLNAQTKQLDIDTQSSIVKQTTIIEKGKYEIRLLNIDSENQYEVNVSIENQDIEPLILTGLDDEFGIAAVPSPPFILETVKLDYSQELNLKITVYNPEKNDKDEIIGYKKERELDYTYKTKKKGTWQTTFGFNFISLGNRKSYFSKEVDSTSTYAITRGANQKRYDFHPSVMFTWLQNNTNDINFGVSGGFGFDLEKSISVFIGGSVAYNKNIIVSLGLAVHNQKLLNSQYKEGDIINENLTFDQLHEDYIRFNPFLSISFRLDKSPF